MNFDDSFEKLLGHEGAYSNDPNDPGGETMWGVTARVARAAGYVGEMKDMTQDWAKNLYLHAYWAPAGCESAPDAAKFQIFDMAVNSGVVETIKTLQRAVGAVPDGVLGPATLQAMQSMPAPRFVARFNAQRLTLMASLAAWPNFSRGWALRIADNLMEA